MRRFFLATVAIGVILAVGCVPSTVEDVTPPAEGHPPPSAGPSEEPDDPVLVADWTGAFSLPLPNGWLLTHCEGDAPMLCFGDGDRHAGVVELLLFPADDVDVDDDGLIVLREHVDVFFEDVRQDRASTCPHLSFVADEVAETTVGGLSGLRGEIRLVDAAGVTQERHVVYWAVREGERVVVNAAAYGDGGCLQRMGEFVPADLERIAELLDRIVADTPLPPSTVADQGIADGEHVARVVGLDEPVGAVVIDPVELLSGSEALAAARAAGEIGPAEDLPNDFYILDGDAVTHHVGFHDRAVITVVDCTATCGPVEVDRDDYLAGRVRAMNGEYALFSVMIDGGRIRELSEIYLP